MLFRSVVDGDFGGEPRPLTLGHEVTAFSEQYGNVFVYTPWGCGECRFCATGSEMICPDSHEAGLFDQGGYAEYMLVPHRRYIFPLGGIVVPIIIYLVKSESPTIRAIARQAILLNLTAFALICAGIVFFFTVLLIPAVILGWMVLAIAAVALPVIGAIRASEGRFYRYPVVGSNPERPLAASSVVS